MYEYAVFQGTMVTDGMTGVQGWVWTQVTSWLPHDGAAQLERQHRAQAPDTLFRLMTRHEAHFLGAQTRP